MESTFQRNPLENINGMGRIGNFFSGGTTPEKNRRNPAVRQKIEMRLPNIHYGLLKKLGKTSQSVMKVYPTKGQRVYPQSAKMVRSCMMTKGRYTGLKVYIMAKGRYTYRVYIMTPMAHLKYRKIQGSAFCS